MAGGVDCEQSMSSLADGAMTLTDFVLVRLFKNLTKFEGQLEGWKFHMGRFF